MTSNQQQEPRRASLHTLGCRLNQAETALLRDKLQASGYVIVPFGQPADLGIVNTCTVTNEADAKSRKLIRSFIRKNPDAFLAVIGCYSQVDAATLAEIQGVDLVVGNQEKLNVLNYVAQGKNATPLIVRDSILRDDFTIDIDGLDACTRRANLKIQDGCDSMCSYCIIPFARGRARSREIGNLLDEARQLVQRGAREIVVTGINVGTYRYHEHTIAEVLERLNEIQGLERIRLSSIEPTTIPQPLFAMMNARDHALVPHLHIPLQSGSNKMLKRMRRDYTREGFLDFIGAAHSTVEGLCIGTDIMVGAPGEEEEDFQATCDLLQHGPLAYAHVFKYSERDGTAAVRQEGKVDPETKNRRSAEIRRISAEKLRQFHSKHLGKTVKVLFERSEAAQWTGYTRNYIRVAVRSDDILENQIRDVTLTETRGELVLGTCANQDRTEANS